MTGVKGYLLIKIDVHEIYLFWRLYQKEPKPPKLARLQGQALLEEPRAYRKQSLKDKSDR